MSGNQQGNGDDQSSEDSKARGKRLPFKETPPAKPEETMEARFDSGDKHDKLISFDRRSDSKEDE